MALVATVDEMVARVRRLTDQEHSEFVTDSEILAEINQALREYWQAMTEANPDWYVLSFSLATTAGTLSYNLFDEVEDWTLLRGVERVNSPKNLTLRSYQYAERNQRLHDFPGLPRYRVQRNGIDGESVTLYFDKDPGTHTYTIDYIPAPPALSTGDNANFDGVLGFEDWLVHHACAWVRHKADEPEAAMVHQAKVEEVKARVHALGTERHQDGGQRVARTRRRRFFDEESIYGE